ncbi:galactose-specific lectin nattectin-like [Xiphophorus couchianus]|uniref:galactose-specific lectin nattectin-like n=1 Tax=Xiphophorus couchianus TaxID=32473 RepID=UPI001016FD90|nr:galactose-specific lectin nattectin-like [Xiphophorus couchianus]
MVRSFLISRGLEPRGGEDSALLEGTGSIYPQPWFLIRPLLCAQPKDLKAAATDLVNGQSSLSDVDLSVWKTTTSSALLPFRRGFCRTKTKTLTKDIEDFCCRDLSSSGWPQFFTSLCSSLSCVLCNGVKAACVPLCPTGWSEYGNRCFLFQSTETDWATAELACNILGANLASIHSSGEHSFLKKLVRFEVGSFQRTWVGGHDGEKEGVWLWSDGSEFSYVKFDNEQPDNSGGNEHCLEINYPGEAFLMNDEKCSKTHAFICAKKP